MKTALELLSTIDVASPCTANWNEMLGDANARFCGKCEKNVYNLSALTSQAALDLIREKEGHLCGRYFRRYDGTILTADCPVGVHHRVKRHRRLAALAASLAGLLSLNGCTRFDDSGTSTSTGVEPARQTNENQRCVMGEVAVPPPKNLNMIVAGGICAPPEVLNKPIAPPPPEKLPAPREPEGEAR